MTIIEAHGRYAKMADRSFLGDGWELGWAFPAISTALAVESGWLDDATTDDDLVAAAAQGEALVGSGVVDPSAVVRGTEEVIRALMASVEADVDWAEAIVDLAGF